MTVTWVLERDVFSEVCFTKMVDHFKANDIPYHIVRVIPFVHEIEGKVPEIEGPCVVYGSIGIQKLAQKHGWKPGVWTGDEFDELSLIDELESVYLNYDALGMRMSDVEEKVASLDWDLFFIKPNGDTKEFAGTLMEASEFSSWYSNMMKSGYLDENDFDVVISTPKKVGKEWRCVMVNGKMVASSLYRNYQKLYQEEGCPPEVKVFGEMAAHMYSPADVFVLDVVETDDGLKIIEYNTFNSSGLYHCDVGEMIDAINGFVKKSKV